MMRRSYLGEVSRRATVTSALAPPRVPFRRGATSLPAIDPESLESGTSTAERKTAHAEFRPARSRFLNEVARLPIAAPAEAAEKNRSSTGVVAPSVPLAAGRRENASLQPDSRFTRDANSIASVAPGDRSTPSEPEPVKIAEAMSRVAPAAPRANDRNGVSELRTASDPASPGALAQVATRANRSSAAKISKSRERLALPPRPNTNDALAVPPRSIPITHVSHERTSSRSTAPRPVAKAPDAPSIAIGAVEVRIVQAPPAPIRHAPLPTSSAPLSREIASTYGLRQG